MDSITAKISDNYKYFDVSVEKFDEKIRYELYTEDFSAKEVEQLSNDSDYDKEFEYIIKLDNGDFILLDSNDEGKTINRILYDFSTNQDGYSAGYFIGVLTRLVIEDLNKDDFNNKVGSEFLSKEEIWEKEISVYVYNHLFYALNIEFDKNNNINKSYFIFKPVGEETNEQYQDMIQQIIDEYLQELEKIEAEEQAKKVQQEKEEQERKTRSISKKVRIFTAGTYIVGRDIEHGVYNIIAISGRGNCFVTSTTRVIETFTPGGDKYAIAQYNNAILAIGGEIEVHSTLKVKFEPVS